MNRLLIAAMATVAVCAVAMAVSALARAGEPMAQSERDTTLVLNLRQGVSVSTVQVGSMTAAACDREAMKWIAHGTVPGVSTAFAHCVNAGG